MTAGSCQQGELETGGPSRWAQTPPLSGRAGTVHREAHLSGKVAAALVARADELFTGTPETRRIDVLAAKLP
ncbi:hypothetical protein [Pseudonocardia sp. H11422]|uniref:hypothetical protein n=1 Tax=Pseudonocardia sp. H11422 TaxID=2835866 RepID=UPI001BDD6125|nr:hypothetical protein [Pseudonocardia sp. H11422]